MTVVGNFLLIVATLLLDPKMGLVKMKTTGSMKESLKATS